MKWEEDAMNDSSADFIQPTLEPEYDIAVIPHMGR